MDSEIFLFFVRELALKGVEDVFEEGAELLVVVVDGFVLARGGGRGFQREKGRFGRGEAQGAGDAVVGAEKEGVDELHRVGQDVAVMPLVVFEQVVGVGFDGGA